jgi:glycine dehydrogenase
MSEIPTNQEFTSRHIGPSSEQMERMLSHLGVNSLDALIHETVPSSILMKGSLKLSPPVGEAELLQELKELAAQNESRRSYIGMGYVGTHTPTVIQRNIFENPGWYTQYTPYQAEIAQGRLEALLNFQTMVIQMTGLEVTNASLLDEATAAAEAMALTFSKLGKKGDYFVSQHCHPQTIEVVRSRAEALGAKVLVGDESNGVPESALGVLIQYPYSNGTLVDPTEVIARARGAGKIVTMACDFQALLLLRSPGELGADIAVGSTQSFGIPLGFGGPHAGFLSTKDENKRLLPGRIVGVSKDVDGKPAIRLALQTREQHIRRDKATSNICTAQVLLAVMAGMYAVYHGPKRLKKMAESIHEKTARLAESLQAHGIKLSSSVFYQTLTLTGIEGIRALMERASEKKLNLRVGLRHGLLSDQVGVTLDELTTEKDLQELWYVLTGKTSGLMESAKSRIPSSLLRSTAPLTHPIFQKYHSETEMLRYITRLQNKDLSLAQSMIPLGSCTMKLNATSEMIPVGYEGFSKLHPFVPLDQAKGYLSLLKRLEADLSEITGFAGVSLQPNAGSQGEYAGLLAIRGYHLSRGEGHRDVCLIPQSAHGTNPASASMAGMRVVVVGCDASGNVDLQDLQKKLDEHAPKVSALMVTYPSTHGVFEESIRRICEMVHAKGGQVYMDGANMNAQVGLCRPGDFGPDVCHLNLHKTFCIPHGGGGPGMGPIGVAKHLVPFLPSHPLLREGSALSKDQVGAVSAAPFGSASILPISYAYIRMMGPQGLKRATEVAILNANYMAKRLEPHYPILYRGERGRIAHECIIDLRGLKAQAGVEVEDVAKRLMDYGFHAPTVSFPVAGTMMIEPTESESLPEMDRFIDAMIEIRREIQEIIDGKADPKDNLLKHAPHTQQQVIRDEWMRPYPRERAAYPLPYLRQQKFWPSVARIDGVFGDRNLVCACLPIEAYQ